MDSASGFPWAKLYWCWLALGIALFVHGLATGDGIAGALLYWEWATFGSLRPVDTHILLALPLILAPIVLLAAHADRHRLVPVDVRRGLRHLGRNSFLAAGALVLLGALAFWRTSFFPVNSGAAARIVIDDLRPAARVPEQRTILAGMPQKKYQVRYTEVLAGRFRTTSWGHCFVPVTRSGWTPDQPVEFLVDTRGIAVEDALSGRDRATRRGLLLRGQVPGFLRAAFRKEGVTLAEGVMLHSTDRDAGREPWYVLAGLCAVGAAIACGIGAGGLIAVRREERR